MQIHNEIIAKIHHPLVHKTKHPKLLQKSGNIKTDIIRNVPIISFLLFWMCEIKKKVMRAPWSSSKTLDTALLPFWEVNRRNWEGDQGTFFRSKFWTKLRRTHTITVELHKNILARL